MSIDSISSQPQRINEMVAQQTREVPGERENDGDSDDKSLAVARNSLGCPPFCISRATVHAVGKRAKWKAGRGILVHLP